MMEQIEINIKKSAVFSFSVNLTEADGTAMDLSGKTVSAQLRQFAEAPDAVDFSVTVSGTTVTLSLTAVQTGQITFKAGVYDVFLTDDEDPADRQLLWEGTANIYTDVTRMAWLQMGVPMSVILMASRDDFPEEGIGTLLYIAADTNRMYRYADDSYVMIGGEQ